MARKRTEYTPKIEPSPGLKTIFAPKNDEQKMMLKTISENTITFVNGVAGTGKSFVSMAYALQKLFQKKYERIILTRPIVEATNERLGFLPGELAEKLRPYVDILYSIAAKLTDAETFKILTQKNGDSKIQILPLAFMRGVTFSDCIVIADEFQNATIEQMRLLLTRIGDNCKLIVCGDTQQSDIYPSINGLEDSFELFEGVEGIGFVNLTHDAIVRHPIIKEIEARYNSRSRNSKRRN